MKKNLKFILLSFFALLLFSCGTILLTNDFFLLRDHVDITEEKYNFDENLKQSEGWYDSTDLSKDGDRGIKTDLRTPYSYGCSFGGWYAEFNGSNYINMGRDYMYTKGFTVHLDAYMNKWENYHEDDMRLISCTEKGGFDILSSKGYICFEGYELGYGYRCATSSKKWADLSSGWHSFDLVFNYINGGGQNGLYLYVDGNIIAQSSFNNEMSFHSTNSIFLGAEAGGNAITPVGNYFKGKIANVVIKEGNVRTFYNQNSWTVPNQDVTLRVWLTNSVYVYANGGTIEWDNKEEDYNFIRLTGFDPYGILTSFEGYKTYSAGDFHSDIIGANLVRSTDTGKYSSVMSTIYGSEYAAKWSADPNSDSPSTLKLPKVTRNGYKLLGWEFLSNTSDWAAKYFSDKTYSSIEKDDIIREVNAISYYLIPSTTSDDGYMLVNRESLVSSGYLDTHKVETIGGALVALWAAPYTIKFNANGGSGDTLSNISTYFNDVEKLPKYNLTRKGYTFAGWKVTSGLGSNAKYGTTTNPSTDLTSSTILTYPSTGDIYLKNLTNTNNGTVTLTAQWTPNNYNATFKANKPGSGTVTQTLNSTSTNLTEYTMANYFTYDSVPNDAKASVTGWTFNGYFTAATGGTQIFGSNGKIIANVSGYTGNNGIWKRTDGATLYAQWTAITYNLNLDANTGTFSGTKNGLEYSFDSNTGILKLNGAMTNWIGTFITYYPTTINKGDTFNVSITKKTDTDKFTTSGGGCFVCDLRNNDSVNNSTKKNISFTGGTQNLVYSTSSTENFDRIGIWIWHGSSTSFDKAEYQITIKRNSSATTFKNITETIQTLTYDTPIKLSTTGFDRKYTVTYNHNYSGSTNTSALASAEFTGWNAMSNGGLYGSNTSSMADITTSSNIGKTDYIKNLTSTKDGSTILKAKWGAGSVTLPSPTRTGYTFNGWYKESACTTSVGAGGESFSTSSDETLYAKWTPINYTITYNLDGGTASGNNVSYTIETPTFTLNNPSKTGWLFNGWTGSNGTTPQTIVTITKGTTGDKEFTANWLETWASVDNSGKLIHGVAPSGAGTEASPYQIASAENLAWYMYQVNFVSGKTGIRAKQTCDIDLGKYTGTNTEAYWYPIGTASKKFAGDYDGQGYMIKNIKTNSKINGGVAGLFGYASAGCIHKVYLVGGDIQGQTYAGGIVGEASGAAIITNNVVYGVKVSGGTIGGIVGNSSVTTNNSNSAYNGEISFNIFCYDKDDSSVQKIAGGSEKGVSNCLLKVNGTETEYSITANEWRSVTNMFVSKLPKSSFFWIVSW